MVEYQSLLHFNMNFYLYLDLLKTHFVTATFELFINVNL